MSISGRCRRCHVAAALILTACVTPFDQLVAASAATFKANPGDSVVSIVKLARAAGHKIVNSSIVVPDTLVVSRRHESGDAIDLLSGVLEDVGLDLKYVDGVFAVVRNKGSEGGEEKTLLPRARLSGGAEPPIPEVITTASKYEILRDARADRKEILRRDIEIAPTFGADPIRASHRLPGVASGGASARSTTPSRRSRAKNRAFSREQNARCSRDVR